MKALSACLALLALLGGGQAVYFEDGYDHHYTYSSESDVLGMHNITSVIKFRVRPVNRTEEEVLHLLIVDSFVQHSEKGYLAENPMKWDLSRRFFFTVNVDGLVTLVHFHQDEKDEVLALKKVLASTFSAKVTISSDSDWSYTSKEMDHSGLLDHDYLGERTNEGYRLSRRHRSSDKVHRTHEKVLTLDLKHTPLHVVSHDNVTMHRASSQSRKQVDGEQPINDFFSGEFPVIGTVSRTKVTLTTKRQYLDNEQATIARLRQDILEIVQKDPIPTDLATVEDEIQAQLGCIHAVANKQDRNRTDCVMNLRRILEQLHRSDFLKLGQTAIERNCSTDDTMCVDERNLFIDVLAGDGRRDAQLLVVDKVINSPTVTEEDLRRCLFHCVALTAPEKEMVEAVEALCFGENDIHHGNHVMTKTQKRACLSSGAMAKALQHRNSTEADRIVEKLETWLKHHNETESRKIIKPRMRRSITEYDSKARKHVETKMVLLKSLGNAGLNRSLQHLKSYMEPDVGILTWRRAAIHSLKHFTCNESASMLLTSILYDNDDVVRTTAKKVYEKHPRKDKLTSEQETLVMRKNYTYPVVARVKRGFKDVMGVLEKGISVHIEPPGIEWDKTIGSSNIGVSFGLHIRNVLDLHLGLLSGHFLVDVLDEAYADAHIALLNIKVDIVKARICFKGHIEYNLNALKDFGINAVQDLVHIYDRVVGDIVNPIKRAVEGFRDIIQMFKGRGIQVIFNTLINTVKSLPQVMGDITRQLAEFVKEIMSLTGSAVLEEIKTIVQNIRNFVDGVKQDVLKFYHSVVDPVVVALPYIGKKIKEAFSLIVTAFKNILKNPMQAVSSMAQAVSEIKMAVSMVVDVKTKVVKACMFLKGRVTAWLDTAKKVPQMLARLKAAFHKLTQAMRSRRSIAGPDENPHSSGFESKKEALLKLENNLTSRVDEILKPLKPLMEMAKPFLTEFKNIADVIAGIKKAYTDLKEFILKGKSKIQKVFGPKFHQKFPSQRRDEGKGCSAGTYPTDSDGRYKTTGVDLVLGPKQSIAAPVEGIVHLTNGYVLFQPTAVEFSGLEIIIHDIKPEPKADGKRFPAGKRIGRAKRQNVCKQNFIHVAVRQAANDTKNDDDYEYMDPSVYLDRLVPVPKWIQECNDHEFTYIGQTTEAEETADGEPESVTDKLKRSMSESMDSFGDDMDKKMSEDNEPYRPDDNSLHDSESFGDSLKESLKEQTKAFAKFFATALFGKGGPKIPNILDIVNVNNMTIAKVVDTLHNDVRVQTNFKQVIERLCDRMKDVPAVNPVSIVIPHLRKILGSRFKKLKKLKNKVSDAVTMAVQLTGLAEKDCPGLKSAIAEGFGHTCIPASDCTALTCNAFIQLGTKTNVVKMKIRPNLNSNSVTISIDTKLSTITLDGEDHTIHESKFGDGKVDLSLIVNGMAINDTSVVSVEAKICILQQMACQTIEILNEAKFPAIHVTTVATTAVLAPGDTPCIRDVYGMSVPKFINTLGVYELLDAQVVKVLDNVRGAVVKELFKEAAAKFVAAATEFKDKMDFCLSANIPKLSHDVTLFDYHALFFAGPVPLRLGFGAGGSLGLGVKLGVCILSMKLQVTLTPSVGAEVWGSAKIDIGFARGGIKLIGYLVETKFPITGELTFSKYPLVLGAKMDLVLTPLRLDLQAFAELNLLFTHVTVFKASIWKYSTPKITRNIFNKQKKDEDQSPPDILPKTVNKRRKREGTRGCEVKQVSGRNPDDTAFTLDMYAQDPVSDVKLSYAVGSHRGGNNIIDWTDMGGASLLVPASLPGGIPLYWTVKAKNSQGLAATTQCFLHTFDNTPPDGRVEHSYTFSSHPNKLSASVIAIEDSPLLQTNYKAIGFSAGQYGSELTGWERLNLDHTAERESATGPMRKFAVAREGKLVAAILKTENKQTVEECAQMCLDHGSNCVSFDYEYHSETCDLHDVVEGSTAFLRISGTYSNYERLGQGYHSPIEYSNLPLEHGTVYFVNARLTNTLGYVGHLTGGGTMVDFTPPNPGDVGIQSKDELRADNCTAAITQRCIDVTWKENHRIIIDGAGSKTVFNGQEPLVDKMYTLTNHYVSANWHGFHDDESGIWGYTWAVGRQTCGTDVLPYIDPYAQLSSKKFWTDSGFHKGIHLDDGSYYVTVQALNGAELGGSLVTTVCHSTPFIVDTTPPVFKGVTDIIYDEDFDLIAIYYEAEDDLSKIARAEFGLGQTKYDVKLRGYSDHGPIDRDDPFLSVEDLGLTPGIPAWIRIRVTNNVNLFTAGNGDEPILIDRSRPVAGTVLDGSVLQQDLSYQSYATQICAQWIDFHDPESGISRYLWGVGTVPGLDNVVKFRNMTRYEKSGCAPAMLKHNESYFSTVFAYNSALNSKDSNTTSNGVLVDITPPIAGKVHNGEPGAQDLNFTSETVTKQCNWDGYYDPESGIEHYMVDVYINTEFKESFNTGQNKDFEDKTISMEHLDNVHFAVHGVNGAGLEVIATSEDFVVDHTPPIMKSISETVDGSSFQPMSDHLDLSWQFQDSESGIREYRTLIYETKSGVKQRFWPKSTQYNTTQPQSSRLLDSTITRVNLTDVGLQSGAKYSLHVTALNGALLSSSYESGGVTVDTSPPPTPTVHIGLPKQEENYDERNNILHDDQNGIRVSWSGDDPESGIKKYKVAVGTTTNQIALLDFTSFGQSTSVYINNIHFESTAATSIFYLVSVKSVNGAGLESNIGTSKSIYIQKANVPGVVFDGRQLYQDAAFTTDPTSIAMSFYGFESESCNIEGYEWAIGTESYGTDVLSYTDYGLVMNNDTHGQAQIHTQLYEDATYFVTVRARTACAEEYILSSSDGIVLDVSPPQIDFGIDTRASDIVIHNDVIYQAYTDSISVKPSLTESEALAATSWSFASLPFTEYDTAVASTFEILTKDVALSPGRALFVNIEAVDRAGNTNQSSSKPIISDVTSPVMKGIACTPYISNLKSLVTCTWDMVREEESIVDRIEVSIGSAPQSRDLCDIEVIPEGRRTFVKDLHDQILHNQTAVYVNFNVSNVLGLQNAYEWTVIVDSTPPTVNEVHVVTSTNDKKFEQHQKCQLPRSYVELKLPNVHDTESGIDTKRFEVSIGSSKHGTDFLMFTGVEWSDDSFFVDGFDLPTGQIFYVTVRAYNKAGLYADASSESTVISQSPRLAVLDGNEQDDIDFQPLPNIMAGRWLYSDACPIREVRWAIHDITGKVIKDFRSILGASTVFYNDEIQLQNGMKYINIIKTLDSLNRTKMAFSDGITVRIQPPYPGRLRDGHDEDLNYQFSVTELSANWDNFGENTGDPTQAINHYEVAVGNDRRYEKTRTNVHYFVNVGRNTSYTFEHLNLTAKLVKYYITVRGYSMAGSFAESYSNGIRVGFRENIRQGSVESKRFQSSVDSMSFSWMGFQSDIGIIQYLVGISSHELPFTNDTTECSEVGKNDSTFDIYPLSKTGLNEFVKVTDLVLHHGQVYYATVVAEDESGMCTMVTGGEVHVDTSNAKPGQIYVNGLTGSSVFYATSLSELHVSWTNFTDPESGIDHVKLYLYECSKCELHDGPMSGDCTTVAERTIKEDTRASLFELRLDNRRAYYIGLDVTNGAGLSRESRTSTILIDESSPLPGQVKISDSWLSSRTFQSSRITINGLLALASTKIAFDCKHQRRYFPSNLANPWNLLDGNFKPDYQYINSSSAILGIGYDTSLTNIVQSGIISDKLDLTKGSYAVRVVAASGHKTVTSFGLMTSSKLIPTNVANKPAEKDFDFALFENVTGLKTPVNVSSYSDNDTDEYTTYMPSTVASMISINNTHGQNERNTSALSGEYGLGVHLFGYKFGQNEYFHASFWARSEFTEILRWFTLPFDPTTEGHEFTIAMIEQKEATDVRWDATLLVDGDETVSISGLKLARDLRLGALTWNEEGFKPAITDIFNPFYSEAVLVTVDVPDEGDKPCLHGRGFYDGESGIKEVWVGVSDGEDNLDNVYPLTRVESFCPPCLDPCKKLCELPCTAQRLDTDFSILPLQVNDLALEPVDVTDRCLNASKADNCNGSIYYLNAKIFNHAGQSVVVSSNAIQVDITSPECEYIDCLDPDYSKDEPTEHIGSSSTIGAYWSCVEDVGQITNYKVAVVRNDSNTNIMNDTDVGLKTKGIFTLPNGTFENGKTYTVILDVTNTAGLRAKASCTVTVNLYAPDVSSVATKSVYANESQDDSPLMTNFMDKVDIEWSGGGNDTEFFEWQVGTETEKDDVFPLIKVGMNTSGSASISSGRLNLDSNPINKSLAEFQPALGNKSQEHIKRLKDQKRKENMFYLMEPGRCIHQTLYAVGWSHLRTKAKDRVVCIRREGDLQIKTMSPGEKRVIVKRRSQGWKEEPVSDSKDIDIAITTQIRKGDVLIGSLTHDDETRDYGSAASGNFESFISNPALTKSQTSRMLRDRITSICNVSFYLAPAPVLTYDKMAVNVTIPPHCRAKEGVMPALVYWNTATRRWNLADEACGTGQRWYDGRPVFANEICVSQTTTKGENRVRRQAPGTTLTLPVHFEVVNIKSNFINHKPSVITDSVSVDEDKILNITTEITHDRDNDTLTVGIVGQPTHGNCTPTGATRWRCQFEHNFYGTDTLRVRVSETELPGNMAPHVVEKDLSVTIRPQNDPPDVYYIDSNGKVHHNQRIIELHANVDANETSTFDAGYLVLTDPDGGDAFTNITSFTKIGHTDSLSARPIQTQELSAFSIHQSLMRTSKSVHLSIQFDSKEHGTMVYNFRAKDSMGKYTAAFRLSVHVLINPCVFGDCSHQTLGQQGCDDATRALSFSAFYCACTPGYKDEWCQTEINECQDEPCALMFDCEDLVNDFRCNINVPKLLAILVCSMIAVGCAVVFIVRFAKKRKNNKVGMSTHSLLRDTINTTLTQDVKPPVREVTSSSIVFEPTPGTSDTAPEARSSPKDEDIFGAEMMSLFSSAPGMKRPPHHRMHLEKRERLSASQAQTDSLDQRLGQGNTERVSSASSAGRISLHTVRSDTMTDVDM